MRPERTVSLLIQPARVSLLARWNSRHRRCHLEEASTFPFRSRIAIGRPVTSRKFSKISFNRLKSIMAASSAFAPARSRSEAGGRSGAGAPRDLFQSTCSGAPRILPMLEGRTNNPGWTGRGGGFCSLMKPVFPDRRRTTGYLLDDIHATGANWVATYRPSCVRGTGIRVAAGYPESVESGWAGAWRLQPPMAWISALARRARASISP